MHGREHRLVALEAADSSSRSPASRRDAPGRLSGPASRAAQGGRRGRHRLQAAARTAGGRRVVDRLGGIRHRPGRLFPEISGEARAVAAPLRPPRTVEASTATLGRPRNSSCVRCLGRWRRPSRGELAGARRRRAAPRRRSRPDPLTRAPAAAPPRPGGGAVAPRPTAVVDVTEHGLGSRWPRPWRRPATRWPSPTRARRGMPGLVVVAPIPARQGVLRPREVAAPGAARRVGPGPGLPGWSSCRPILLHERATFATATTGPPTSTATAQRRPRLRLLAAHRRRLALRAVRRRGDPVSRRPLRSAQVCRAADAEQPPAHLRAGGAALCAEAWLALDPDVLTASWRRPPRRGRSARRWTGGRPPRRRRHRRSRSAVARRLDPHEPAARRRPPTGPSAGSARSSARSSVASSQRSLAQRMVSTGE